MQMLIATRLTDGRVVFLTASYGWTASIDDGIVAQSREAGAELLEIAQRAERASDIVDPYLIDVVESDGRRRPAALRESIRAFGPSVPGAA
jgi:hypothetical protein